MAGLLGRWRSSIQHTSRSFYVLRPYVGRIKNRVYQLNLSNRKYVGLLFSRQVTLGAGLASALVGSVVWCYSSGHGKIHCDYKLKVTKLNITLGTTHVLKALEYKS
jgi:hypothetical protein